MTYSLAAGGVAECAMLRAYEKILTVFAAGLARGGRL